MPRINWLTDIHLEFLEPDMRVAFASQLAEDKPDIVLLGGDTGIASNFDSFLQILQTRLQKFAPAPSSLRNLSRGCDGCGRRVSSKSLRRRV